MSSFFDNLMAGMTFGLMANNPFFGGCFGFGMYPMYNRVDFGGFANPFPSIFTGVGYYGGGAAQLPPTTFANQNFPTVDFTWVGETVWDTYANPDSEYNKQLRKYYEEINKQYEESQKDSKNKNNNYQFQFPFLQAQAMVNPWQFITIPDVTYTNPAKKSADLEPDVKDSEIQKESEAKKVTEPKKNNNSEISYDAKELKNKWSKEQPQLTDEFYSRVVEISKKVKCSPDDLMALMNLETGRTFSPSEKCGKSSATGLIQFTKATAKTLGTTTDKLKKMSAVEQLDYVEKYLVYWKKTVGFKDDEQLSAGDLYALVAQPANAGKEVLIVAGTDAYKKNKKSWDLNNDKKITKAELADALKPFMA